jgi:hypothetical protein
MSRYSTSATNVGSTHVAFGFLMALVSFDLGLTTVSSCFLSDLRLEETIQLRREDFRRVFEKLGYRTSSSDYREAGPRSQLHGSAINGRSLVLGSWQPATLASTSMI